MLNNRHVTVFFPLMKKSVIKTVDTKQGTSGRDERLRIEMTDGQRSVKTISIFLHVGQITGMQKGIQFISHPYPYEH